MCFCFFDLGPLNTIPWNQYPWNPLKVQTHWIEDNLDPVWNFHHEFTHYMPGEALEQTHNNVKHTAHTHNAHGTQNTYITHIIYTHTRITIYRLTFCSSEL